MELEGAKRSFEEIENSDLQVKTFVSGRHAGIAKWLRNSHPTTKHYLDLWHVLRNLSKKLIKASKEKDCQLIADWIPGIRNHLYWSVLTTRQGFQEMIIAKWRSILYHVRNVHMNFGNELYNQCNHGDIENRDWIHLGKCTFSNF